MLFGKGGIRRGVGGGVWEQRPVGVPFLGALRIIFSLFTFSLAFVNGVV